MPHRRRLIVPVVVYIFPSFAVTNIYFWIKLGKSIKKSLDLWACCFSAFFRHLHLRWRRDERGQRQVRRSALNNRRLVVVLLCFFFIFCCVSNSVFFSDVCTFVVVCWMDFWGGCWRARLRRWKAACAAHAESISSFRSSDVRTLPAINVGRVQAHERCRGGHKRRRTQRTEKMHGAEKKDGPEEVCTL